MEKRYYNEEPKQYETIRSVGIMTTVVRFNIAECTDEEHEGQWECEETEIPHKEPLQPSDYGYVVASLVRAKYSSDSVEAITQNYIASKTTEHKREWTELQQWREDVKVLSKQILNMVE